MCVYAWCERAASVCMSLVGCAIVYVYKRLLANECKFKNMSVRVYKPRWNWLQIFCTKVAIVSDFIA